MANTGKAWRQYQGAGSGVHFPYGVPSEKELHRINMLVELDNRRKKYKGNGSRMAMFKLAAEYRRHKMPMMAAQVYAEAKSL